jgi:hypothetical protein
MNNLLKKNLKTASLSILPLLLGAKRKKKYNPRGVYKTYHQYWKNNGLFVITDQTQDGLQFDTRNKNPLLRGSVIVVEFQPAYGKKDTVRKLALVDSSDGYTVECKFIDIDVTHRYDT